AVHERLPVLGLVHHVARDVARDVGGDQRRTALARLERAHLLVQRAHFVPLRIVQRRPVHRARQAVLGVLRFAARVDDGVVSGEPLQRRPRGNHYHAHFSCFLNSAQTFSMIRGCASARGWMPSGWNMSRDSTGSPSSRKGTSPVLYFFAMSTKTWEKRRV